MVSIIMLSHNGGRYVEESVRSVIVQTYQNWELLFVDNNSKDATVSVMMGLMDEDREVRKRTGNVGRIRMSHTIYQRGTAQLLNAALKEAKGRWIAFLNVGDVWEPTKLERQIAFMETHDYAFSYTQYGLMNRKSEDRGVVVSGKAVVTKEDMMRCCWPAYLTVMYDAEKTGVIQVRNLKCHNDYALCLNVSERADCHLLEENLARMRTPWNALGNLLLTNKLKWRYEVYRIEEDLNPFTSCLLTLRNLCYGVVKWWKFVERK